MKIIVGISILISPCLFGQNFIPEKDTIIYRDSYEVRYHTEAKAIFYDYL
jgi:hypothetical protein